jgi:type VII secretion-associated protein (TIGR03931 family)
VRPAARPGEELAARPGEELAARRSGEERPGGELAAAAERAAAAVRELDARVGLPPGPSAVLEVGSTAIRVTILAGPDGTVLGSGQVAAPAGRGWSETSVQLLTGAAAELGHTLPTLTGGVLVIGERANDADLSRRLTEVCGEPPWLPGPVVAAVPGGLRSRYRPVITPKSEPEGIARTEPEGTARTEPAGTVRTEPEGIARTEPAGTVRTEPAGPAGQSLGAGLFPPQSSRRRIRAGVVTAVAVATAGLLAGLVTARAARPAAGPAPDATALVQYDYALRLPAGWRHSGGLPERRRTLLTPTDTPDGSDLVSIEQTPLGYDGTAEADRAHRELAERFRQAAETDPTLDGPPRAAAIGGRDVIAYRQALPRVGATVDWFVLFVRDAQLSVGCQHTPSGADAVAAACAEVVASLRERDARR